MELLIQGDESLLQYVLGLTWAAQQPQGHRIYPRLVELHQLIERT